MKKIKINSFEPDSNQRPKDDNLAATVLRSTNWAIEGMDAWMLIISWLKRVSKGKLIWRDRT